MTGNHFLNNNHFLKLSNLLTGRSAFVVIVDESSKGVSCKRALFNGIRWAGKLLFKSNFFRSSIASLIFPDLICNNTNSDSSSGFWAIICF